jgi:hypothetical protein
MRDEHDDDASDDEPEESTDEPDPGEPWAKFSTGRDPDDDD